MTSYHNKELNFLSEEVRLGLDKEIRLDGTCLMYFPFCQLIEGLRMTSYHKKELNFLSEEVRLGLDKEIRLDGTYLMYFPFSRMIERSRMTSYHKKFNELLNTLVVLTSTSINTNLIAGVDEQRHLNSSTSVYSSSLKRVC